jgi:hypothetical protein
MISWNGPKISGNRYNFNRWSVPELSQRARAPLRLSMEGVGELISPDFCLTIPLLAQSWDYNKPEKITFLQKLSTHTYGLRKIT